MSQGKRVVRPRPSETAHVDTAQADRRSTSKLLFVASQSRSKTTRKRSRLLSIASFVSRAPTVARRLDPDTLGAYPWPVPCRLPVRPRPQKAHPRTLTQGATVKSRGQTLIEPVPWLVDWGASARPSIPADW